MDLVGGGVDSRGGYISKILFVKMKELGPLGGERAPGASPLDPPMMYIASIVFAFVNTTDIDVVLVTVSINILKYEINHNFYEYRYEGVWWQRYGREK